MKLNNKVRQEILKAALEKSGLPALLTAAHKSYGDLAEKIRLDHVKDEAALRATVERAKAEYRQIPELLRSGNLSLNARASLKLNVAGEHRVIYWCGASSWSEATKNDAANEPEIRVAPSGDLTYDGASEVAKTLHEIDGRVTQLKRDIEGLTAQINAVLNSVSTEAQLYKIWPEAVAFVPKAQEKASAANMLPAVLVAELNKALGLP